MQFEKRQFAGMPLDILVGHPEHELLFIATQALSAAGLQVGKRSVQRYKDGLQLRGQALQVKEVAFLVADRATLPPALHVPRWADSWLFTEAGLYDVLLHSKAPQVQPFRKWVTEEVLPSLRKTGTYTMPGAPKPPIPVAPPSLPAAALPDLEVLSVHQCPQRSDQAGSVSGESD